MDLSIEPLIYIGIFVGILMLVEGIYLVAFGKSISLNSRVNRRLEMLDKGTGREEVLEKLRKEMQQHMKSRTIPLYSLLADKAQKAAIAFSPKQLMTIMAGLAAVAFVGLSIGGMIAQGLAVKRMDLVRAMVLSNTAAKIGQPTLWEDRINAVRKSGIAALSDAVMERWFSAGFRATPELELWRNMLTRQPDAGYAGCCAAISGSDFFATTATLRLPTLGIAGSEDGATPPDLMRETTGLIPGSQFHLIRRAGHLPCVEKPQEYAQVITDFMRSVGHI